MGLKEILASAGIASAIVAIGAMTYESEHRQSNPRRKPLVALAPTAEVKSGYRGEIEMVSGDFDNDGDLDLAVGTYTWNDRVGIYILKNDGNGNLSQSEAYKP